MQAKQMNAPELVATLLDMTLDPAMPGDEAIAAWRVRAADFGHDQLAAAIDSHDADQLARLWDYGTGGQPCSDS